MSQPSSPSQTSEQPNSSSDAQKDSYVKLAMRNMVRKGGTSVKHFVLTSAGLLAVLVGLAYLTR